jgi:deazaflavin-dependent oxidoreductase (nitroreductase family)
MRVGWKLHRLWYRASGGRVGTRVVGLPVLRLTTTGRTSGKARAVMLTYLDDPRGFIVIASNAGDQRDPAWWRNLQADPAATAQIGGQTYAVRMRQLEGNERERAWHRAVAVFDGYARYAASTARTIPVALLDRGNADPFTGRVAWES